MFGRRYFAPRYFAPRYFAEGANPAPAITGVVAEVHKFRSATVPPTFTNLDEVQRFLQRAMDEIARALNPVRVVGEGGTGVTSLDPGEILAGGDTPDVFNRVKGNATLVRKILVSVGDGFTASAPFWDTIQSGDIPGASPSTGDGVLVGTDVVFASTSRVTQGTVLVGTRVLVGLNLVAVGADHVIIH